MADLSSMALRQGIDPVTWHFSARAAARQTRSFDLRSRGRRGTRRRAEGISLGGADVGWCRAAVVVLAVILASVLGVVRSDAQEQPASRTRAPSKISGGTSRQAFSGKVQSLDLKRNLLNVDTVEGGVTEIFPVKKGVTVSTAYGGKLKLTQLSPGTNVIVYYEQKGGRRTVSEIVVLAVRPAEEKKTTPPPS